MRNIGGNIGGIRGAIDLLRSSGDAIGSGGATNLTKGVKK